MNQLNDFNQRVFDAAAACLDKRGDEETHVTDNDVHAELADPEVTPQDVRDSLVSLGKDWLSVAPHKDDSGVVTYVTVHSIEA